MIVTITLNPAVDKTIEIPEFTLNTVNRVKSMRTDAGGKGINVSKVIKVLKGESKAVCLLAGNNGKFIKDELDKRCIKEDCIWIEGETRVNVKVVDKANDTYTDINEKGPTILSEDISKIKEKIIDKIPENSMVVLSGSVPVNFDALVYKEVIEECKNKNIKCVLDADGELLKNGIQAVPYMIKPNIHEIEKLFDKKIDSMEALVKSCEPLLNSGIEIIAVSLGSEGAVFLTREKKFKISGLKVEVKSTVGAGDSMVAALTYGLENDYCLEEAAKLGVASSTAAIMTEGTKPGELEVINKLRNDLEIQYL